MEACLNIHTWHEFSQDAINRSLRMRSSSAFDCSMGRSNYKRSPSAITDAPSSQDLRFKLIAKPGATVSCWRWHAAVRRERRPGIA